MPYAPIKSETYHCQGGINQKVSLYIQPEGEFLNLQNVDFRVVGALSSFAGTTAFTTSGISGPITGVQEYFGRGALQLTATDTNFLYDITAHNFQTVYPYVYPGITQPTSYVLANDLYGVNGWDAWAFQGQTAWQFSLGKLRFGSSTSPGRATSTGGLSGNITMWYSLVREDGLIGPSIAASYSVGGETAISFSYPSAIQLAVGSGISTGSFGISGIQAWVQLNQNLPLGLTFLLGLTTGTNAGLSIGYNFTSSGGWFLQNPQPLDYQGTFVYGFATTFGINGTIQGQVGGFGGTSLSFNPLICEYYANQFFAGNFNGSPVAGASLPSYPSRVRYSNPGTPEISNYENFFDVNPNDPNGLSAMRTFFTSLVFWKETSTYVLTGTGPDSFVLTQVSPIYGCLGPNANCVWDQNLWFLDAKGIFEFNGANVTTVSNKVQPIFSRMNVPVAIRTAWMLHVKERNEIWCAIPIDGALDNNVLVVYDYLATAWTTRTLPPGGINVASIVSFGNLRPTIPYFGAAATGLIGTFGSSLIGDFGQGITAVIKSRFIGELGNSVTKLYRRLYVDSTVPAGVTYPVLINLYADKNTVPYYSTTMLLTQYQNRIDFGIPAKSLAAEFIYNGATFFQVSGFTVEFRYQRNT